MARSLRTPNVGHGCLVVCFALVAFGCGPELGPPSATNPPPPGFPTDTAGYRARLAEFPGTRNAHKRSRKAKCFPFDLCTVDVTIEALGNTQLIYPHNAPDPAVPVAHLVNLDSKTEKYYGLLPKDSAEYDLWVNRKPGSTMGEWRVVGVMKSTGQLIYGQPTDFDWCHVPPAYQPTGSDADFAKYKDGDCNYKLGSASSTSRMSLLSSTFFSWLSEHLWYLASDRTAGGWIDCNNGCCT